MSGYESPTPEQEMADTVPYPPPQPRAAREQTPAEVLDPRAQQRFQFGRAVSEEGALGAAPEVDGQTGPSGR